MGPDLEMQGRSITKMEVLTNKDGESTVKAKEVEHIVCASNYEDNTFEMGTLLGEGNHRADETENMTESSSSFGDTISDKEMDDNGSDTEVVSEFCRNTSPPLEFGGCDDVLRLSKKRLTPHWREYIQPLMWRFKWAELQMKKFQSQAFKYDKILAENKKRKQLKIDSFAPGLSAKSLPYANDSQRVKIMKRKTRKRTEDSLDTAFSNHILFSYPENTDAASNGPNRAEQLDAKLDGDEEVGATCGGLGSHDVDCKDESWEKLLRKISVAQSKVVHLKDRLHKVTSENAGKIFSSSTDKLSLLAPSYNNTLTGSMLNHPASPPNNGDRMGVVPYSSIASQLVREYNKMSDLIVPQSAASSHGGVTPFPGIIESMGQPHGSWTNTEDVLLIHNKRENEELNDVGDVKIHTIDKKLKAPKRESVVMSSPMAVGEILNTDDKGTPKSHSNSKIIAPNKKKRAKRKPRTGKWSRRSSG